MQTTQQAKKGGGKHHARKEQVLLPHRRSRGQGRQGRLYAEVARSEQREGKGDQSKLLGAQGRQRGSPGDGRTVKEARTVDAIKEHTAGDQQPQKLEAMPCPIPEYCTHPERMGRTCRGCERSMNPERFDGGCKNLFESDR